ncbi:MAG: TQO small subunit DoxD [Candidatus Phosphoribacter sp.]
MSSRTTPDRTSASHVMNGPAHDRATSISAFLIRITVALLWIDNLSWKVPPDFGSKDRSGLYYFTSLAVEHPVLAPYTSVVETVVLPHFAIFGWAVFLLEIALAAFLLLGLATRFWALVAIAQSIAIFLSVGASPNEWKWSYFLMAAAHLAVLGLAAGRVWGIDAVLRRRLREGSPGRLARLYLKAS